MMSIIHRTLVLATALLMLAATHVQAAPGDLDGSFGAGGVVTTDVNTAMGRDNARTVFVLPDGKLLAAGNCDNGYQHTICLAQYSADGSLDASFGANGTVVALEPENISTSVNAAAMQADGKILTTGYCGRPYWLATSVWCVTRFNADGSRDNSFGAGELVALPIVAYAIAPQQDGKIVVAGQCSQPNEFCLARLDSNGVLDTSFGTAGLVLTHIGDYHDEAYAVAIQSDGRIVAAGICQVPGGPGLMSIFCVARYNTDGSLDTSFDGDGIAATDVGSADPNEWPRGIALQQDGKILVVGRAGLVRYNTDGSLDTNFDGDGKNPSVYANAVALQENGKIITVGHGSNTFVLSRFNTDGSPDSSIGVNGVLSIPFGGYEDGGAYSVAIQNDGKIVAGGMIYRPNAGNPTASSAFDLALLRFFGDPTNQIPDCSGVVADITVLAKPDHDLQLITLSGATDSDGDPLTLTVTGVTQDEPVNGAGDGNTSPDAAAGPTSAQVFLRGERSGNGDGRVYRIAFSVNDGNGGICTGTGTGAGTVQVSVPRGQGAAVDSGTVYDSFGM